MCETIRELLSQWSVVEEIITEFESKYKKYIT